ncbi:MFS transporter [Paenibacillus sp. CGMCC 1.16610]|uniref:MFS transporter n=1 Tax=Paenibacillus anseongense TaxID=2682845 RepID=A0ABW9U0J4_9BACL|nr:MULTISPECIES: MFS transporter [Paenibacillus]MBA2943128.1 MFS transporter [Paenibacillus sp. CGMCC 1.16610]MVQ33624.1 MFS transporter [Paenibacillus anseongense]
MHIDAPLKKKPRVLDSFLLPFIQSRSFPYLWLSQLISMLGGSVTTVILPMVVYSLTGSTTMMGLVMTAYMLPYVLMLPLSGWIVDRYDRVRIMMLSDIVRFIVMLAIAVLIFSDSLSIPMLFGLVSLYGLMEGLFHPAYSAVRATVFTPDIRNAANALTQVSNQGVKIIGPVLGGLIVSSMSASYGFGLDALTYLISYLCLLVLVKKSLVSHQNKPESSTSHHSFTWKREFLEGITILKGHPWLWITILAFCFINICYTGIIVILIPWLFKVHLGLDPLAYGIGITCSGVGAIAAALLFGSKRQWHHRGIIAYGAVILSGAALLTMTFTTSPIALSLLMAVEGFGLMIFGLIWETSLQVLVPPEAFGRVVSLDLLGSFALLPLSYFFVGWIADQIGGVITISIFASIGLAIVASVLCVPAIRRFQ